MDKKYTIDATGRTLGRVSSEVAKILMGKNSPDYVSNKVAQVTVTLENVSKTKMTEKRKLETYHERYSGYPGGFKKLSNEEILSKKGWPELYKLAVYGMLPANKLRPEMMKRLIIKE